MPENPNPNGPEPKPGEGDQGGKPGDQGGDELSAERTARAAAEKRAETAEAEATRLRRSNAAQKPGDLDALREEIRTEFTGQLVRAEIPAAAAGRLRDPADALALVDVAGLVGESGDVDAAKVAAALDQLVKDKPYLALTADTASTSPAPWGDVGSGQRESTDAKDEPATPFDRLRDAYNTAV